MSETKTLYDEDFAVWLRQQAEALRSAAQDGSNQALDWENLAEEIEDLAKRERRELASRVSTIIEHLVKLARSPAKRPRSGWIRTVRRSRIEINRILEQSPSLRNDIPNLATHELKDAVELALEELAGRGEARRRRSPVSQTRPPAPTFSYTPEQILGDWFPPEPKA
jgi:hypothetical protein